MTQANGNTDRAALELRSIRAAYGGNVVVRDASLSVPARSIVALIGPNGAGKTTLLRVAAGQLKVHQGETLLFGDDISKQSPNRRARRGLCLVPEGRGIFRALTVRENLLLYTPPWATDTRIDRAIEAFPFLSGRLKVLAGSLSGGQQQMLALARVYLAEPRVALLDEVSMGLAPIIIDEIFTTLRKFAESGIALLVVEQYVTRALAMSDHVYMLNQGDVIFSGSPSEVDEDSLLRGYLGTDAAMSPADDR
jgi:branched-chain amino acid transport system ATP-binding protein